MLHEHPGKAPSDLVIRSAAALLGILAGVGVAFALWGQLQHTAAPGILDFAVVAMALGIALVSVAMRPFTGRLFLWALAASLMLAFFVGAGPFAAISG